MKQFPQILREEREKKHLSQNKLAKIIGTSSNMVRSWELGEHSPSFFNAMCLAQALDISLDKLAGIEK